MALSLLRMVYPSMIRVEGRQDMEAQQLRTQLMVTATSLYNGQLGEDAEVMTERLPASVI